MVVCVFRGGRTGYPAGISPAMFLDQLQQCDADVASYRFNYSQFCHYYYYQGRILFPNKSILRNTQQWDPSSRPPPPSFCLNLHQHPRPGPGIADSTSTMDSSPRDSRVRKRSSNAYAVYHVPGPALSLTLPGVNVAGDKRSNARGRNRARPAESAN